MKRRNLASIEEERRKGEREGERESLDEVIRMVGRSGKVTRVRQSWGDRAERRKGGEKDEEKDEERREIRAKRNRNVASKRSWQPGARLLNFDQVETADARRCHAEIKWLPLRVSRLFSRIFDHRNRTTSTASNPAVQPRQISI